MESDLERQITGRLYALEPVFHRVVAGSRREVFEAMTSSDYWEVGASGRVYGRESVVATLVECHSRPHEDRWIVRDFRVRRLAERVWPATYVLDQSGRRSRRATIWRQSGSAWVAEYHQGTLVDTA